MAILVCLKVTFYFLMATITMFLAYLVVVESFFFIFLLFCRVILKSLPSSNGSGNGDSCLLENYFLSFLMASIMEILVCLMIEKGCFIFTSDFKITCFFLMTSVIPTLVCFKVTSHYSNTLISIF